MMTQPKYVLDLDGRKTFLDLIQTDTPDIRFESIYRDTGSGGPVRILTPTGKINRSKLQIFQGATGRILPATTESVKSLIREMRPSEAEALDDVDKRIEQVTAELHTLRATRWQLLKKAWQRGWRVPLESVIAMATERTK